MIRHPKDGASRLYAYVHWFGSEMVRGHANGYGYDKQSAAVGVATSTRIKGWDKTFPGDSLRDPIGRKRHVMECIFWEALKRDDGKYWSNCLREMGFTVVTVC